MKYLMGIVGVNSEDLVQTAPKEQSGLGLHCLPGLYCLSIVSC